MHTCTAVPLQSPANRYILQRVIGEIKEVCLKCTFKGFHCFSHSYVFCQSIPKAGSIENKSCFSMYLCPGFWNC